MLFKLVYKNMNFKDVMVYSLSIIFSVILWVIVLSVYRINIQNHLGEKADFYKAPASTRFHGDYEGGLVEHSMKVYEILAEKIKHTPMKFEVSEDTVKIVALLHDICKANFYKVDYRNAKNELGVWEKVPYYTIDDTIPYGHGEKSVMMITEYMKLTSEEKYAIRWHMGFTEPKEQYTTLGLAFKKYPLALLMHEADLEATYFFDI